MSAPSRGRALRDRGAPEPASTPLATLAAAAGSAPAPDSDASSRCRIGVLVDSPVQERWVLDAVHAALAVPGTRLVAIGVAPGGRGETMAAAFHRLLDTVDGQVRCRGDELLSPVDVTTPFAGVPRVRVTVDRTPAGWLPDEAGLRALRAAAADVWLCFCAESPRVPLPDIACRGVLALEIGVGVPAANRWAGAAEIAAGSRVTVARVVDYGRHGRPAVYEGVGATIGNSARRNRLMALRRAAGFFGRSLTLLASVASAGPRAELPPPYPVSTGPTVTGVLRVAWRLAAKAAANRWRALGWHSQWQIGYAFGDAPPDLRRLRYLVPPHDRFWADPFAVSDGDRRFIFFEEFRYRTGRGRIVAVEVDERGSLPSEPLPALERPYHLSYPFVFRWRGALYMLPESAENGTVELYRCDALPSQWRLERVLLANVKAYDATLWEASGRWWMFATIAPRGTDGNDELHLYSSPTPLGPWTPHPRNPVIVDTRRARSAGPVFAAGGNVYRPSQDCSVAYGHSISMNRIETLDERDYRETPTERIEPGWRPDVVCVHTFGRSGRLWVVDALIKRPRWRLSGGSP